MSESRIDMLRKCIGDNPTEEARHLLARYKAEAAYEIPQDVCYQLTKTCPSKHESSIDKETYTVHIKTAMAKLDTNDFDIEPVHPSILLKIREIHIEAVKNNDSGTSMAEKIKELYRN